MKCDTVLSTRNTIDRWMCHDNNASVNDDEVGESISEPDPASHRGRDGTLVLRAGAADQSSVEAGQRQSRPAAPGPPPTTGAS